LNGIDPAEGADVSRVAVLLGHKPRGLRHRVASAPENDIPKQTHARVQGRARPWIPVMALAGYGTINL
jgi:hypothetical protein